MSTSEQSDNSVMVAIDHVSSKHKHKKHKRRFNDSGLDSDEALVKHKRHKSIPTAHQCNYTHDESVLSNSDDKLYKRKHKHEKYKK